jgi:hypothetical protein
MGSETENEILWRQLTEKQINNHAHRAFFEFKEFFLGFWR